MKRVFAISATFAIFAVLALSTATVAAEPAATLHAHADQVTGKISPYATGACIEDVNHEIYGGIYSQMVFGESFQEPAPPSRSEGFTAYGGSWTRARTASWTRRRRRPEAASATTPPFARRGRGRGLLRRQRRRQRRPDRARSTQPGVGADNFTGYEMSLDPDAGT